MIIRTKPDDIIGRVLLLSLISVGFAILASPAIVLRMDLQQWIGLARLLLTWWFLPLTGAFAVWNFLQWLELLIVGQQTFLAGIRLLRSIGGFILAWTMISVLAFGS